MVNMKLCITANPATSYRGQQQGKAAFDQPPTHELQPLQHCERNVHRKTVDDVV